MNVLKARTLLSMCVYEWMFCVPLFMYYFHFHLYHTLCENMDELRSIELPISV